VNASATRVRVCVGTDVLIFHLDCFYFHCAHKIRSVKCHMSYTAHGIAARRTCSANDATRVNLVLHRFMRSTDGDTYDSDSSDDGDDVGMRCIIAAAILASTHASLCAAIAASRTNAMYMVLQCGACSVCIYVHVWCTHSGCVHHYSGVRFWTVRGCSVAVCKMRAHGDACTSIN